MREIRKLRSYQDEHLGSWSGNVRRCGTARGKTCQTCSQTMNMQKCSDNTDNYRYICKLYTYRYCCTVCLHETELGSECYIECKSVICADVHTLILSSVLLPVAWTDTLIRTAAVAQGWQWWRYSPPLDAIVCEKQHPSFIPAMLNIPAYLQPYLIPVYSLIRWL